MGFLRSIRVIDTRIELLATVGTTLSDHRPEYESRGHWITEQPEF